MQTTSTEPGLSSEHASYSTLAFVAIAVVFGAFGGFAARAPLDSAAIAPGRVSADSSTKPIQHLEGGIVREILVKEAQAVKEGQVLFRLEPTQAQASFGMLRKQLDLILAQEARLATERDGAARIGYPPELQARRSIPETAAVMADQERQFNERRTALHNETQILRARLKQIAMELSGQQRQATATRDQITNLDADISNLTPLMERGLYPKSKLMAMQRERSRLDGQLGGLEGQISKLDEVQQETQLQIDQAEQKFRGEAGQQLAEVRARLAETRERLGVADDVVRRIEIKAPQSGIVQGLKVFTAGAVVKPGEALAELVPSGDKLIMAVRVSPLDIDSVERGQRAEVRFPGFSTRGLPTILGRVERVGADVMRDEFTKDPYYLARVEVDQTTIPTEIERRLQPGMPADVLIVTGERTVLQYLVGPLTDLIAKSMRER